MLIFVVREDLSKSITAMLVRVPETDDRVQPDGGFATKIVKKQAAKQQKAIEYVILTNDVFKRLLLCLKISRRNTYGC